eukprot:TRINITY_DN18944_c0_g1_i1.p2 TRINITY_DN18944_c0_g1~~TRINITY_DN18944_c0_g1_i1.p2  ORF type:complete len:141 (-),score=4.51 TRINITY_DN18944_c0_g1_i1:168-590(-)
MPQRVAVGQDSPLAHSAPSEPSRPLAAAGTLARPALAVQLALLRARPPAPSVPSAQRRRVAVGRRRRSTRRVPSSCRRTKSTLQSESRPAPHNTRPQSRSGSSCSRNCYSPDRGWVLSLWMSGGVSAQELEFELVHEMVR